jgi:hypothetical protein
MRKLVLLYVCFTGLNVLAQDNGQVIILDRTQARKHSSSNSMPRRMVEHKNVYKFDPIRMAIGEVNFAYERVIGDQSSLEIELGPTVSNLGANRFDVFNSNTQNSVSAMGFFTSAGFRFYPLDGRLALNQLYISPKFKFRRYNEMIEPSYTSTLSSIKGFSNESIFTFNFGYQQWLADRFSFDYYIGLGIGSYASTSYRMNTIYDGTQWKDEWQKQSRNYSHFVGTIGMKVGIGGK